MYNRSRTPPPSARARSARSTRSARGSTKSSRRGKATSGKIKLLGGPAKKWVKIKRSPGPKIRLQVAMWVPLNDLTEEEQQAYQQKQLEEQKEKERKQQQQQQAASTQVESVKEETKNQGNSHTTEESEDSSAPQRSSNTVSVEVEQTAVSPLPLPEESINDHNQKKSNPTEGKISSKQKEEHEEELPTKMIRSNDTAAEVVATTTAPAPAANDASAGTPTIQAANS